MKILVIGCGSIGRRHIRLLKEMGVEVGGYDVDQSARERAGRDLTVTVCNNMDEVWDFDPEGVIIATPNHMHLDATQEAFLQADQRGYLTIRGVLVEKPLAVDVKSAQELLKATTVGGIVETPVLVGYCLRYHPGLMRVRELVSSGALGQIRHATFHFGHDLRQWRPGTDYRSGYACKRETGGGILLDASHEIDLANWFFGQPQQVMAMVRNTGALEGMEAEDLADVLIDYGEVQVSVHVDYLAQDYRRGRVIIGDKGTLDFNMHPTNWGLGRHPDGIYEGGQVDRDAMYRSELGHFLSVIRGEESPACTGEDGIRVLRLVEAARRSSEEGRVIQL